MDDTLYDEFGNYIGPDLGSSDDDSDADEGVRPSGCGRVVALPRRGKAASSPCSLCLLQDDGWMDDVVEAAGEGEADVGENGEAGDGAMVAYGALLCVTVRVDRGKPQAHRHPNPHPRATHAARRLTGEGETKTSAAGVAEDAIVLHEDKQYYPDASEVYPEAETMVQDEDTQMLSDPIIAPIKTKLFSVLEKGGAPETTYSTEYMVALMDNPHLVRNVALAGQLAHGTRARLPKRRVTPSSDAYLTVARDSSRHHTCSPCRQDDCDGHAGRADAHQAVGPVARAQVHRHAQGRAGPRREHQEHSRVPHIALHEGQVVPCEPLGHARPRQLQR